jgi:glycosyltransferase involved in cell wall biosynthesis
MSRLWIDVEDLFEYARSNKRPSGIQRLAFEIYRIMRERIGDQVQFVRHDVERKTFRSIPWMEVAHIFDLLTEPTPTLPPTDIAAYAPARRWVGKLLHRYTPALRPMIISAVIAQATAFRAWKRLLTAILYGLQHRVRRWKRSLRRDPLMRDDSTKSAAFLAAAAPGDVLLVVGAPWHHADYAQVVRGLRRRGLRFAILAYDIIPVRRPEWCDQGLVRIFRQWLQSVLPLCDAVFAISQFTASDIEQYAEEIHVKLPGKVIPIPIGTGFGGSRPKTRDWSTHTLPPAGTYVLFVSTIEPRKNHMLLFRIWRKLIEDLPDVVVPNLVFAGRVGWMVNDLMQQIRNTDHLDGKLEVIEDSTDAELAALYRGCLFTVFPSFYEGWGLPVTESLAFGKPCIISNRTSLPEAGGKLARVIDPDNFYDAYRVIRETIEDRVGLAEWEATVRREFQPVPWSATVDGILRGLNMQPQIADQRARRLLKLF